MQSVYGLQTPLSPGWPLTLVFAGQVYNVTVLRAALLSVVIAFILIGSVQGQRAGGMFNGHPARVGIHSGFAGQHGPGFSKKRFFHDRFHLHHDGFGSFVAPYSFPYYEVPYWYEQPAEAVENVTAPLVIFGEREQLNAPAPATAVPASPQLIELPGFATSKVAKPLPATIFILKDGQRFEARRYVLTAKDLSITIGRQQRTVPLDAVDIDATVNANHEHGIDLRIPADRNEISLSF